MKVNLYQYNNKSWEFNKENEEIENDKINLVLCFGSKIIIENGNYYATLKEKFTSANIIISSTAGEILGNVVNDDSIICIAFELERTNTCAQSINISDYTSSYEAGKDLITKLPQTDLKYVLVLSDGSLVNGGDLVNGLNESAGEKTLITGGIAGDSGNFQYTLVGLNEEPKSGNIVAIGFYGHNILINFGSDGGWDCFGLERVITKSENNKLLEIDSINALDLYKKYLGHHILYLPSSALLFPLFITIPGEQHSLVRTILSIDEQEKSMTFAGNLPIGSKVRLMKGNLDNIKNAATKAAKQTLETTKRAPKFALLISCVGRKLVLKNRVDEEIEAVREVLPPTTLIAGFYSYGEIVPFSNEKKCQLHNQTMTITTFDEL
jgi:hypothetical protein